MKHRIHLTRQVTETTYRDVELSKQLDGLLPPYTYFGGLQISGVRLAEAIACTLADQDELGAWERGTPSAAQVDYSKQEAAQPIAPHPTPPPDPVEMRAFIQDNTGLHGLPLPADHYGYPRTKAQFNPYARTSPSAVPAGEERHGEPTPSPDYPHPQSPFHTVTLSEEERMKEQEALAKLAYELGLSDSNEVRTEGPTFRLEVGSFGNAGRPVLLLAGEKRGLVETLSPNELSTCLLHYLQWRAKKALKQARKERNAVEKKANEELANGVTNIQGHYVNGPARGRPAELYYPDGTAKLSVPSL